jgi:hypothetical protein
MKLHLLSGRHLQDAAKLIAVVLTALRPLIALLHYPADLVEHDITYTVHKTSPRYMGKI